MNTASIKKDITNPFALLSQLDSQVVQNREELLAYAKSLGFEESITNHLIYRIGKAGSRPMLGEYAPFLLSSLSYKHGLFKQLSSSWMLWYESCLIVDDLEDERYELEGDYKISELLENEAKKRFYAFNIPNQEQLWEDVRKELKAVKVWESQKLDSKCNTDEFIKYSGKKLAPVKLLANYLTFLEQGRVMTNEEVLGINHICSAIQILDDINDITADFKHDQKSIIISLAQEWATLKAQKERSGDVLLVPDEVLLHAILSKAYSKCWRWCAAEIDLAKTFAPNVLNNLGWNVFDKLKEFCVNSAVEFDRLLADQVVEEHLMSFYRDIGVNDNICLTQYNRWDGDIGRLLKYVHEGPRADN